MEEHCNMKVEDIVAMADYYLNKEEIFKHCAYCGFIYQGKGVGTRDYTNPIIDLKRLTGNTSLPFGEGAGYKITSGICDPCLKIEYEKIHEMRQYK